MNVSLPPAELKSEIGGSPSPAVGKPPVLAGCIVVTLFVVLLNAIWFALDNRVPSTDEAGHILNAIQYKELYQHFRPWKLTWLQQFLSVNPFYPPAVYVYDGALKLALGNSRLSDNLCFLSYVGILTASTYGIAWQVSSRIKVAVVAALLMNLYPQIAKLSHVYMLDLPLAAMVATALLALMWWRVNPTWARTIIAGCALAGACFTKQLGVAFLLPPCLYLVVDALRQWRGQGLSRLGKLFAMASIVVIVMAPWVLVNIKWINGYAQENAQVMAGRQPQPLAVFIDYFVGLGYSMSFLLTVAFFVAWFFVPRQMHRQLILPYIMTIGGLALTSLLSCTFALDRYAAPALIVTAIVTACGAITIQSFNNAFGRLFLLLVFVAGACQYFSFSYCPYPVSAVWVSQLGSVLGVELREFRGQKILRSNPMNAEAWGQSWAVNWINRRDPGASVWLNILPSQGFYNPHSFELLAREIGLPLRPTTSRRWTIMGDQVEFSPETALYYHWYLLKSGDQGNQFQDSASASNYAQLIDFVKTSGKFEHVADKKLPDASVLSLYRQR